MRKVFVDQANPGYVRFVDDPMGGFIAGMEAANFARAINCHDELVELLSVAAHEAYEVDHDQYNLTGSEDFDPREWKEKAQALVAKARGEAV